MGQGGQGASHHHMTDVGAALQPDDDYRGANLNDFGQMAETLRQNLSCSSSCTRGAQMPQPERPQDAHTWMTSVTGGEVLLPQAV